MISYGSSSWGTTCRRTRQFTSKSLPRLSTGMSIWGRPRDSLSRRLLTGAGLPLHRRWPISWEPVLQGLQVQEKLNRRKILRRRLAGCVLCLTALIRLLLRWWTNSSRAWPSKARGRVSMSSTESISKSCLSSPNNSWSSEWLFSEKGPSSHSSSTASPFPSCPITVSSLPWTLVMQAEHNFLITWNHCSGQSVWWFLITPWSLKSCFSLKGFKMQAFWVKKWSSFTNFHPSSFHPRTTTISVWEQSSRFWSWPAHSKEQNPTWKKTVFSSRPWSSPTFQSSSRLTFHCLQLSFMTCSRRLKFRLLQFLNCNKFWLLNWQRNSFNLTLHSNKKSFNFMILLMSDLVSCWSVRQEVESQPASKCWLIVLQSWKKSKSKDFKRLITKLWTPNQFQWAKCTVKLTHLPKNGLMVLQVQLSEK